MTCTILFSGHMVDKPGREKSRFPASRVGMAGIRLRRTLQEVLGSREPERFQGIAAAACGGDILFHEACEELHIPSEIYLALPVEEFKKTSVAFAGEDWVERYERLVRALPVHILFPEANAGAPDSIWEDANQWMLDVALADGPDNMTLVALWDDNKGETGGTSHMIKVAGAWHATIHIIDVNTL